jgi:hypothetical protein
MKSTMCLCGHFRPTITPDPNFAFRFKSPSEIVVGLHPQPSLWVTAKSFCEANRHLGTDTSALIYKIIERLPRHTKNSSAGSHGQPERLKTIVPDDAARVRWIFHGHVFLPFLVVVNQFNIIKISVFVAENNPPIGPHSDGPKSCAIAS